MAKTSVYLDHNAASPILHEAADAVRAALGVTGNPSSVHSGGRAARAIVEQARDAVAEAAGANRRDVVFTGSATEALAQAIIGGAHTFAIDEVLVGAGEHPAVLRAAEATGLPVVLIDLDSDGVLDMAALKGHLDRLATSDKIALVVVQAVNNETGIIQPLKKIEILVGPTEHLLVIDAVQAFGKSRLDFTDSVADMMVISGHKIGAPAGIGALLMKSHCDTVRLIPGGGQELGRRAGTEALLPIAGLGAAASAFAKAYNAHAIAQMTAEIERSILTLAPDAVIFGRQAERMGNVVNFAVPGLPSSTAMIGMDLEGVCISSGSACSSGKVGRSHVLAAMGVAPALMDCTLRVSLGWNSSASDIAAFSTAFEKILARRVKVKGKAA